MLGVLLDHLPSGVIVEARDRRILYVNREFRTLFGLPDSNPWTGLDCAESLHGIKRLFVQPDAFIERVEALWASRKTVRGEALFLADGRVFERDFIPLVSAAGHAGNLWLYRDVTERRQSEERLDEAERQYRTTMNSMSDAIHVVDKDLTVLLFNETFREWNRRLGLQEDVIGKPLPQVFPFLPATVFEEYRRVFASGQVLCTEDLTDVHGTEIFTETRKIPVIEHSRVVRVITVIRDITERTRTEAALRKSEERLKLAMDATSDGLFDWNLQSGEAYFSPRYYLMLGYDPGEWPANLESVKSRTHADDRDTFQRTIAEYFEDRRQNHELEFRIRAKSGEWRWILSRGKVVEHLPDGSPLRMVGTHVDITDRKQAERLIQKNLKEKELLLKEIHHRVKNNLNVITSLLNLQSSQLTNRAQAVEAFRESRDRIRSMALVHTKLYESNDFSRIPFDGYVQAVVTELLKAYPVTCGIKIDFQLDDVSLDISTAVPCGLILNELVTNAVKHAFHARRRGKLTVVLKQRKDGRVLLTVSDDGVGLPKSFDPKKSRSFGMQLIAMLAEQLNATLSILRRNGASVTLELPVRRAV
jgi:PAS domain S-box-containing protein